MQPVGCMGLSRGRRGAATRATRAARGRRGRTAGRRRSGRRRGRRGAGRRRHRGRRFGAGWTRGFFLIVASGQRYGDDRSKDEGFAEHVGLLLVDSHAAHIGGNQYPIRGNQYSGYRNRLRACVWKLKRWHPEGNNPCLQVCDLSRCFRRRALLSVLYRLETAWFPDGTVQALMGLVATAAVAVMPQPSIAASPRAGNAASLRQANRPG